MSKDKSDKVEAKQINEIARRAKVLGDLKTAQKAVPAQLDSKSTSKDIVDAVNFLLSKF